MARAVACVHGGPFLRSWNLSAVATTWVSYGLYVGIFFGMALICTVLGCLSKKTDSARAACCVLRAACCVLRAACSAVNACLDPLLSNTH